MTLPELRALTRHWARSPPVHIGLAVLLGGLGGKRAASPQVPAGPAVGAMDGMAMMFGSPTAKFRPPCRMQEI